MSLYELPAKNPFARPFRIFGAVTIFLFLCLLVVSIYDPEGLSDTDRHRLAYAAGTILLLVLIASFIVSGKIGIWKWKRAIHVEIASGKIVLRRTGQADVEIPLDRIETAQESSRWLIVRGGEPTRGMIIPREVCDYEGLRRELTAHHEIVPGKTPFPVLFFVPSLAAALLGLAALYLAFSSRNPAVRNVSGAILFLWSMWGFYSLNKRLPARGMRLRLLFAYVATWLTLAWILFKAHLHLFTAR